MKTIYKSTLIIIYSIFCFAGCFNSTPPPPLLYTANNAPNFMLIYYPYDEVINVRTCAAPIPDYTNKGWSESRMECDIRRVKNMGIDTILLNISLERFSIDITKKQVKQFLHIADMNNGLTVQLVLKSKMDSGSTRRAMKDFISWFMNNIHRRYSSVAIDNKKRSMIFLDSGIAPIFLHPSIKFIKINSNNSTWVCPANGSATTLYNKDKTQVFVPAAYNGQSMVNIEDKLWTLPRNKGKVLRNNLWQSYANCPKYIIISSWNNYKNGDFIEPNSLDNNLLFEELKKEINRVKSTIQRLP